MNTDHRVSCSLYVPGRDDPKPTAHWIDVLAPICHTVKYVVDGVEHCTVIWGDDMANVLTQVKELTTLVKKSREQESALTEDIPHCDKHGVPFERHSNERGSWYSHKTTDGCGAGTGQRRASHGAPGPPAGESGVVPAKLCSEQTHFFQEKCILLSEKLAVTT